VWGEEPHAPHTREDLARLVYDLRRKLEADPARPRLLQTVRGFGYRLITVRTG
jgi:DNA-binding response OmpR family regulator